MSRVRIEVDIHELRSAVPSELERLGVDVAVTSLPTGDYDVGGGTLVERKSGADLALSLASGRLWRQVGDLRRRCRFPVLLLEGAWPMRGLGDEAGRGLVLAVVDQGVVALFSRNTVDSALWIAAIARRRQERTPRDRPPYTYRERLPRGRPGEAVLCAVRGISVHHARALLEAFGSVRGIIETTPDDWLAVRGIGPARVKALLESFETDDQN